METERKEETPNAQLLRSLVTAYTEHPKDVEIESTAIGSRGELLKLRVNRDDHPKVVGGQGKQIQALRTIFQFIGARDSRTLRLVLLEPKVGTARAFGQDGTAQYDPDGIRILLDKVLKRVFAEPFETEIYDAEDKVMVEFISHSEEEQLADGLLPYVASIFHAIGRRQGHDLYLERRPYIDMKRRSPTEQK